ncbi:MAG: hypothetical protein WD038_01175 [Balneolales bacterium]
MKKGEKRIKSIIKALDIWLNESDALQQAVDQTVNDELFTRHDIAFSLDHIRASVTEDTLSGWSNKAGADTAPIKNKTALCLHAGNLPLVGFQDVMAVLLSGFNYAGKISRKDQYLLPGFLELLKENGFGKSIQYSLNLNEYKGLQANVVMFSGSGGSAREVMDKLSEMDIVARNHKRLIRTAGFSMAYLDRMDDLILSELTEAMLRYEGKGCRSVALVVSPFGPEELMDNLGKFAEKYWEKYPPIKKLSPKTRYRYAYNKALGKKQQLFRHILIQQNDMELENENIICMVKGDDHECRKRAESNLMRLQNIYTVNPDINIKGFEDRIAPLNSVQTPPINWQPDGVGPLRWLVENGQS